MARELLVQEVPTFKTMIRDYKRQMLEMDFSSGMGSDHPCDVDMFYIARDPLGNQVFIFGEIKNEQGTFGKGQRNILRNLADNLKDRAVILFITHNKRVENGDTRVDVMNSPISEIYENGKWLPPSQRVTVNQFIKLVEKGKV